MPPRGRGRGRGRGRSGSRTGGGRSGGSGPSNSKPEAALRRIMREPSVKRISGASKKSNKSSEGASSRQSVARSVSSSSWVSSEVSSETRFVNAFWEEYGPNPDSDSDASDAQSCGFEPDEETKRFQQIAAGLPYDGLMMLLFETPTGFALFTFPGVYCYLPESVDNLWAEFGDPLKATLIVYPKGFVSFEDKSSAITEAGVDKELVDLINRWHLPGMNLCVGKTEYKRIIESVLKIPCMCCQTVMEIMWGIQPQMSQLVPREKSKLTKEDRLPMSQGLKKFLSNYGYDVKPEMVNEKIVMTACCLFHYDVDDKKNLGLLRRAGLYISDISGIACKDWDILKLGIAVKVICCPEEELTDFHGVLSKDVVSKLKGDAPKYKGIPFRACWLSAHEAAVSNRRLRTAKEKLLRSLVKKAKKDFLKEKKAKKAYEAEQVEVSEKIK